MNVLDEFQHNKKVVGSSPGMPARKAIAKNRKRRHNATKKRPLLSNPQNDIIPDVDVQRDVPVYETESNKSWINVRYWTRIISIAASVGCYCWATALRNIKLRGTVVDLILIPMTTLKAKDGDKSECLSLNTFAYICLCAWIAHFMVWSVRLFLN